MLKECRDCRALWTNINRLHRRQATSTTTTPLDVNNLTKYFRTKIETIRQSTSDALRSIIIEPRIIEQFTNFKAVTVDEIMKLLRTLPSEQCSLDTVSTWLVISTADYIAPLLCGICCASLKLAVMPVSQKQAVVYPRLKKATLDLGNSSPYRPISSLSFTSKLYFEACRTCSCIQVYSAR